MLNLEDTRNLMKFTSVERLVIAIITSLLNCLRDANCDDSISSCMVNFNISESSVTTKKARPFNNALKKKF